ncbi:MAG: Bax inhibitor-1 family protein [Actinomycetia bacterium]|nr:Bax inhibitor-1 family protein [Actinomycetes bacterium]
MGGYRSRRSAGLLLPYDARTGRPWSLTGSLLASTVLYFGLYLAVAAAGAAASLALGVDAWIAQTGGVLVLPLLLAVVGLSVLLNRAAGQVGRQILLGALILLVLSPFLGLAVAAAAVNHPAALASAALAVGGSVVVTAAIAWISPWDLTRLGGLALVAVVGLVVTQLLGWFLAPVLGLVTSPVWYFLGTLVFALYLVVDLSRLKVAMAYGPDDALAAFLGLALALDVINLFLYLLAFFGGGNRR